MAVTGDGVRLGIATDDDDRADVVVVDDTGNSGSDRG
jgi:hypothetical protein